MIDNKKILFNLPKIVGDELRNLKNLSKLKHFSGNGYYTKKCSSWLVKNIKCKEALMVNSCTAALDMCALLLDIKPGDEIIMPSYTFVSTANAFASRGAKPVFIDINRETLNIDENMIENAITKRTKAIVVVHYAGVACEMDKIIKITKKNKLVLIEDAAQAILSKYKGKYLGSFGDFATFSFHETKNIHCGQGGALLINNKKFIKRAKVIRDKGTNRDLFNKNLVKKYTWVDKGSEYAMSEINSAFLYSQLKKSKKIITKRLSIWKTYEAIFLDLKNKVQLPVISKYKRHNGHIFFIILKKDNRDEVIKFLNNKKIYAIFHYIPLHSSPAGIKISKNSSSLKNTNYVSENIIRLPLHNSIKKSDIIKIKKMVVDSLK
jgi:dTDP-4-amino-4,6-dideoxygalactose transaminase